ncbi:MAG: flavodoxin-dependent (E)-4-hydroxy-3-methylbut-2-enyl-diphosphate synthase [Bacilli bacterium]|jgi:(E)-4-hydroxy-3-methylbut-2-enyl-diphosphate synthase|nr:flavodoxin-dependent (E)-4-hydroxy-3-methylbut-2-enyl-diphosphate synthase [Bacilli bacterium]MCH4210508.1 flavodoxin-dependent (E)-4-hydroxy-3-methylbut-2-enyl-diphosphate synthase [Bacilli bacterium]MCH4228268.1 flavodoxin-dependent (E)-4-hydroxy-3-methylbut-2-enyl-diphosphate synthase [Bacilli bacterium]MCH4277702.1 flavodoxin-dependent (E)-4-hydroxy-3-methylbut-2-enyl-diphosphate synthase [Bacilli bacterium]MCI2054689.1 flavodoxin-dependent (E)-4-hydroxy-3-methylbut-2-enyl-diphosphate sy
MKQRETTRSVALGQLSLGGNDHVYVQSMCNIKTSRYEEVSEQINRCAALGAEIMRVSVLDFEDAAAIKEIKKRTSIPLVADIHIDHRLALASLESGVDAIRINPGNIGDIQKIKEVVEACKLAHAPIRIGVNSGSLDKSVYYGKDLIKGEYLFESAEKHVKILESLDFHDIVISLKGSSVEETIEAYRLAAKRFPYPLHLGITEAGPKDIGLIRSAAGLSPLLLDGIGNTIRISLSDEPEEEIKACNRLLHDLDLKKDYPTFISCPTCGRTQVNLIPLAKKVLSYLEENHINKTVAIMGCIVNGPGEARHADLGAAGGKGCWAIFKKGEIIKTVDEKDVYLTLVEEINKL